MNIYPKTQYTECDGAQIAFQVIGSGPVDLVHCSGAVANCEHIWDVKGSEKVLERLSGYVRLILFDRRGTGHSDPFPAGCSPTWEGWTDDVIAVMDAAGSRRAVIHGERDGGVTALLFAATHPERVQALSLGNTTARYLKADDYPCGRDPAEARQFLKAIREKWGTDEWSLIASPGLQGAPHEVYMRSRHLRGAGTPRQVAENFRYFFDIDARTLLSSIRVPTLVTNRANQSMFPIDQGRYLAEHIPNARFLEVPGQDVTLLISDDTPEFLEALVALATGAEMVEGPRRALATVFFCDIVGSTNLAAALGDSGWHELLHRFYAIVRGELAKHHGREIDTSGDGFFVVFDRPTAAIHCARAIISALAAFDIRVRCGIHTGECSITADKLTGMAVHVGARIAALADPGSVWVSDTVKALAMGSGIGFVGKGQHELKGVPDVWNLFVVDEARPALE